MEFRGVRRVQPSVFEGLDEEVPDVILAEFVDGPLHHGTDNSIGDVVLDGNGLPASLDNFRPLHLESLEEEEVQRLQDVGAVGWNDHRDDSILLAQEPDVFVHVGPEKFQRKIKMSKVRNTVLEEVKIYFKITILRRKSRKERKTHVQT